VRATGDRCVEVAFAVIRGGEFEDLTQVWFLLLCRGLILVVSFLFDFGSSLGWLMSLLGFFFFFLRKSLLGV
jgi:hypothetical protein